MYIQNGKLIPGASTLGYRSVAVPGTVAGLEMVLKTHGTMKLARVMAPAIRLAKDGFPINEKLVREFDEEKSGLEKFSVSKRIFLTDAANQNQAYKVGDIFRQPELAGTDLDLLRPADRDYQSYGFNPDNSRRGRFE